MKSSWKTNLQITANCLCDCRIKSCIQEYTVIQEEGQYTGKTQHNLPKDDKTTNLSVKSPYASCFQEQRQQALHI